MAPIFRGSKLDPSFIARAKIQVSFNVEDADLTTLRYKKELQYLYEQKFFSGFFDKNKPWYKKSRRL